MRLATILEGGGPRVALVRGAEVLPLDPSDVRFASMNSIAAGGQASIEGIDAWSRRQPAGAWRALDSVDLGPAVPEPNAIFAIGLNYAVEGEPAAGRPPRPLVYAKLPASVTGHGSVVSWDRSLTDNVDAEVELGVVIGEAAFRVGRESAWRHVFGFTCINDISSRDPWLDGDQWLLGKSLAGFCPVGPVVVTSDELDPADVRLTCTVNGVTIQDGRTSLMRFSIADVIAYLSRHTLLRPGDLIATGTPARLAGPIGPEEHLSFGDVATAAIEGIGELTVTIG